jgi:putative PEP-CTERM system histidine kinase
MLAAFGYAGLGVWCLAIARQHARAIHLASVFGGMALWIGSLLLRDSKLVTITELLRDFCWLAYLFLTTRAYQQQNEGQQKIVFFCLVLGAGGLIGAGTSLLATQRISWLPSTSTLTIVNLGFRWLSALIGVAFAHYLFRSSSPSRASGFRLIVVALGIIWAYYLNLYTLMLLGYHQAVLLLQGQGLLILLLLPGFAVAARRKEHWKVTLSRQATTRSLLFVAIGTYFVILSTATRALTWAGAHGDDIAKLFLAVALAGTIIVVGLLARFRARIKALFVRHLFEHRYDYRTEWLRFSATIGDRAVTNLSPEERVIRSVADVTESRGGVLLVVDRADRLALAGSWQWSAPDLFSQALPANAEWIEELARSGRILNLDDIRATGGTAAVDRGLPGWLLQEQQAWVAVPLVRSDRLIGIVLLGRPRLERALDWEDFDLLRVIAQQVAVHVTDAQNQTELDEARRFEEFNRRFAFIIHDLKNVVSQLSLVSSNAAQHGANPKFQAAMAKTLENATAKMTVMLTRLSTDRMMSEPKLAEVNLTHLLSRISRESYARGVVTLSIEQDCDILADEDQLSTAIEHLVTNAIEASKIGSPVALSLAMSESDVIIAVEDSGEGMSPDFIRKELFKPFASTKINGFGIGAAEARSLVNAMGGDMEVVSFKGKGSRFAIRFPALLAPDQDRN